MDRTFTTVAELALHSDDRSARNSYQMASAGFQVLLALEILRRTGGTPKIDQEIREFIRRMSRENPRWGVPRIQAELHTKVNVYTQIVYSFFGRPFAQAVRLAKPLVGNLMVQREVGKGWAIELGYVGTRYVGVFGMWDPFLAPLASPSSPITVRDVNGNNYSITTNTVNNEELRHQVLGLSRKRGSRYLSNFGLANYNSLQMTVMRRLQRGLYFQVA